MEARLSGLSNTFPSFVSSVNLLRVHSASSSGSLMKMLNRTPPGIDPWGIPLVTSFQLSFVPLMGMSVVVAGFEQQRDGIKKRLAWLPLVS